MLGRVRRSSISSLEQLELERQPPKLIKSDSLSIYESTLLKLKDGSRRDISACCMNIENGSKGEESCAIGVDSSSSSSCEDSQRQQQEKKKRNFSLANLFLRYTSSHRTPDEDSCCSSANTSPCPSSSL